ncbi:hypothetical protein ACFTAO_04015 [Paenibacillus rhizoplanae]
MLYLVTALFLGTAVIFQPVIAVAAVFFILLLVASLSRPELISYFVLLTTAVSINFFCTAGVCSVLRSCRSTSWLF